MHAFARSGICVGVLAAAAISIAACTTAANRDAVNEDPCIYDPSYCLYPIYEGSILVGGQWHSGRFRYDFADAKGTRQFWINKGWVIPEQTRDGDAAK